MLLMLYTYAVYRNLLIANWINAYNEYLVHIYKCKWLSVGLQTSNEFHKAR